MATNDHDSNSILVSPLKTKSAVKKIEKIKETCTYLNKRGMFSKTDFMENECPCIVKEYLATPKSQNSC